MNIKETAKQLQEIKKKHSLEVETLIAKKIRVNWRKYANDEENFHLSKFETYRNDFLKQFDPLQSGRINYYMEEQEDSVSPSNYASVERLFLYGWTYENGHITSDIGNMYKNETKTKYMKFLCECIAQ